MINWLRKKTRQHITTLPVQLFQRQDEMIMPEQDINKEEEETLKLCVCSESGEKYFLDVRLETTINDIMKMSIFHFRNPFEAADLTEHTLKDKTQSQLNSYRLYLVRNMKALPNESTVRLERLVNNDQILLLKCRKPTNNYVKSSSLNKTGIGLSEGNRVTRKRILAECVAMNIPPKNHDRDANPMNTDLDFKITFRQIIITMIEASINLISPEDNAADQFVLVFEQLVKRHKPRIDKNSLKDLMEMGFSEASVIKALHLNTTFQPSLEWLLSEKNKSCSKNVGESDIFMLSTSEEKRQYFLSGDEPTAKVMEEFIKYVDVWFVPDLISAQNLVGLGYGEDDVTIALRNSGNIENVAKEILEGKTEANNNVNRGFDRDAHIMSAILDSPVVQVALTKTKTLFAMMVLCETPNNVNVWLSDPETHAIVSQILRIYHAEKHRIGSDVCDMEQSDADLQDHQSGFPTSSSLVGLSVGPNDCPIASMPVLNEIYDDASLFSYFSNIYTNTKLTMDAV